MMLEKRNPARPFWSLEGKQAFAILGIMRSGSNLLERTLDSLPDVCCHGEIFNDQFIGFRSGQEGLFADYGRFDVKRRNENVGAFVREVMKHSTEPVAGFRIFPTHSRGALLETLHDGRIRKILLRRNFLQAFVSLQLALATDQWIVLHPGTQKKVDRIRFDAGEYAAFVAFQGSFYNEVHWITRRTNQELFCLDYEELKSVERLNELAQFIGSQERFTEVPQTIFQQHASELKEKVENYDEMVTTLRELRLARYCL